MRRPIVVLFACLLAALLVGTLSGCAPQAASAPPSLSNVKTEAPAAPPKPAPPAIDYLKIRPNEAGHIPIVMYHAVGAASSGRGARYDRNGLNIPPEVFRQQLQRMYEAGWHPVNMRDALTAHLDAPPGKIPVVLTFDDGRGTQFRYRPDGSVDPDCAVGILEAFHAEHPDWPLRATFFVLTNRENPVPFYQRGMEAKKLQYLLARGFEIGNHSARHRFMSRMDAGTLQWEVAECIRYIRRLAPAATMDTFCLPYGARPRSAALVNLLLDGRDGGTAYHNRCVLNAWGGPSYPPAHRKFDHRAVPRIGSAPGEVEGWITRLKAGREMRPFVSDGDPTAVTVPQSAEKEIDRQRLDGARLVAYDDGAGKKEKPAKRAKSGKKTKRAS